MMKMNSVRLASAALAAVFAAPCLSSASIILGGCEQLDPNPYMQEASQASAELGGDQSVSVTCLNDDGVPVKRVYTYMQSNGQYKTEEQPLNRGMRALNYARTRTGAYIIGAGVVTAVGVVVYKSYRNTRAVSAAPEATAAESRFRTMIRNRQGISRPHTSKIAARTFAAKELGTNQPNAVEFMGNTIPRSKVKKSETILKNDSTNEEFIIRGKGQKARLIEVVDTTIVAEAPAPEVAEVGKTVKAKVADTAAAAGEKLEEAGKTVQEKAKDAE